MLIGLSGGAWFLGLGAFLAGCGSLLSGIAALRASRKIVAVEPPKQGITKP